MFIINPKYEYRNSKQIQNIKILVLNFTYYSLFRVSDFVLRIYLSLTSYIFLVAATPHQVIPFL